MPKLNSGTVLTASTLSASDIFPVVDGGTADAQIAAGNLAMFMYTRGKHAVQKTIVDPNNIYNNVDTQIPIYQMPAAATMTRIHISGPTASPTSELDINLRYATDTTSWTGATTIDVCDTTSGVVTITSGFDTSSVPSGGYLYWEFGAEPHADWVWFFFRLEWTH